MSDFEQVGVDDWDTRPNRMLVAMGDSNIPCVLYHEGGSLTYDIDMVGATDVLGEIGKPPAPGIWVWEGGWEDDGPGDWPGTREVRLTGKWRTATAEEVTSFRDDEHVWEIPPEPKAEP